MNFSLSPTRAQQVHVVSERETMEKGVEGSITYSTVKLSRDDLILEYS